MKKLELYGFDYADRVETARRCEATEGPLIHDGSQTTAASDLSGSTSTLGGQNGSGQFLAVYISGSRLVSLQTTAGSSIYGVLQNKPQSGQAADVGIMGVTKGVAGGTINAGDLLMVNASAQFQTAATTAARVGVALEAAVPSTIFTMALVPGVLGRESA